nr:hypothetical protein Cduv_456 [Cedratvirus duvanny]
MLSSRDASQERLVPNAPSLPAYSSSKVGHENHWYQTCFLVKLLWLVKLVSRTIATKHAF